MPANSSAWQSSIWRQCVIQSGTFDGNPASLSLELPLISWEYRLNQTIEDHDLNPDEREQKIARFTPPNVRVS